MSEKFREEFGVETPIWDVEASQIALLAREADTWVPKPKDDGEFWQAELY